MNTSIKIAFFGLVLPLVAACSLLPERTAQLIEGKRPPTATLTGVIAAGAGEPTGERDALGPPLPLGADGVRPEEHPVPIIRRGTGRFVGTPGSRRDATPLPAEDGTVLNMVGVDIREAVQTILGDTLGLSYVIDPAVSGQVTLRSSQPLAEEDLIAVLQDVLAVNGAALVREPDLYRIVPREQAPRTAPTRLGRSLRDAEPGYAVQIVPLSSIGAAEMQNVLEAVTPEDGILRVDEARNLLVLGGSRQELATMLDLVDAFDVDWLSGMSFALFPLDAVPAETLAEELEAIFGAGSQTPQTGTATFLPVERLNALLVVSRQPALLEEIRTWIRQLDRDVGGDAARLYVYPVQNGRASDLAAVLGGIFGGATGPAAAPGPSAPRIAPGLAVSERIYRQPAPTVSSSMLGEAEIGPEPATPLQPDGSGQPADASPPVVQQTITVPGDTPSAERAIRVTADDANNALVLMATPQEFRRIEATLRQLDVAPLQVLVEATIAEVTLNDELRYGLQYFFQSGNVDVLLTQANRAVVDPILPGFSVLYRPSDARIALSALESITDLNVISSPQLMVLNNQTAVLQVGDQVPVPVQSAVSVIDPLAPIVNTIQYRDTGVILYVTPRVNANGRVTLEVVQEVSDVVPTTTSEIDAPTIQQRRIQSTIAIDSGDTIALGGLIRDARTKSRAGIPILSSLPLLGALFSTTENTAGRTELLVLITPRVVRGSREARDVTDELRRRLRAIEPL
ncbi:type II secretion system secretin GspD [Arenibaculum sp.]|jgi:general secretion pathway protein D|uniref:type II secretion system secretin GspD n=1 Tax=Arenibaculum sp. TaxID=2865862 RepID=UPI002E0F95F8|nr:type II secretion system secretin GspD [Arenibaculum sp.]